MKDLSPVLPPRFAALLAGVFFIALLFMGSPEAQAQAFGAITGTVTDPSGAIVAGAKVTVTDAKTGEKTQAASNSSGSFVFPSLPPTGYTLTVSAPGFNKYTRTGVVLEANQSLTVNVSLQVGSSSQTVIVNGNAPQVDTTTGTLSQVIGQKQANELPLNGRNAAQLTTLVAGVVLAPADGANEGTTKTFPVAVTASANGSRADQTNFMLDGGNNTDEYTNVNGPFPFPDALQEFSVQTSNYSAEYGQNAGAVVNIVTRSGGRKFHGDAFEYLRNGLFDARDYFATQVDPLKRHQFGGVIGGPVILPHISGGRHTFFFFGYQHTQIHDKVGGSSAFVPTTANRSGDFSALLDAANPDNPLGKSVQIYNPRTGSPYPNNQIPSTDFDPAAVALEKYLPTVGGDGQVFYQQPTVQTYNEFLGRIDQNIGQTDHLFGHYYYDDFDNAGVYDPSNLLTYTSPSNIRYQSALLSESHVFTPNLLNNLVVNYTREISTRSPPAGSPDAATFGVNIYQPPEAAIQEISAIGFFNIVGSPLSIFQRNNYTLADDLHWTKGNHSMAFGVHAELSKFDINAEYNQFGSFTFNSDNSGYALASLQTGYLYGFTQGNGDRVDDRGTFLGFYGQDSWKMSRRFTLDYGLRYEPFYPWAEIEHRLEQFNPAAYAAGRVSQVYTNAPPGLLFPGDSGLPEQGVRPVYHDFMPRVGFAFDPGANGRTVLRGGAGVFYDSRLPGIFNTSTAALTPFSYSVSLINPQGPFSNPFQGMNNPFPFPFPVPSNVSFPSPVQVATYSPSGNFKVPVTYDWNLTIEHQITPSLLERIAYVGSHSSHLVTDLELNPAVYTPGSTLTTNQRRIYQGYSSITDANMGGNSAYNSLQATLQMHSSKGLTVLANYTWSKTMDNIPLVSLGNDSDLNPDQSYVYPDYFPNFKALDIGPADFDHRNVFSGSYVYALPTDNTAPHWVRALINGWTTTGIVQAQSGDPLTVVAGEDVSQTGLLQDRAVLTGRPEYGTGACHSQPCVNWLNPSAYALPTAGTFGNVQKNSLRGPDYVDWDAGALRSINLEGRLQCELRAEYFNVLNHTQLADPKTSVSGGGFGSITSTGNYQPRIAQFSAKLVF